MARRKLNIRKQEKRLARRKRQFKEALEDLHRKQVHVPYGAYTEPGASKRG